MADGKKRLVRISTAARIWGISRQAVRQAVLEDRVDWKEIDGTKFVIIEEQDESTGKD